MVARSKSIQRAARSGDHLKLLLAMQDTITMAMDRMDIKPSELSSLVRRQIELSKEITDLKHSRQEGTDAVSQDTKEPDEKW